MKHKAHDTPRFLRKTIDIHPDLVEIVQEMADDKKWSFSFMAYTLMKQAVKEKFRKKSTSPSDNQQQIEKRLAHL